MEFVAFGMRHSLRRRLRQASFPSENERSYHFKRKLVRRTERMTGASRVRRFGE